jgi:hypothetical protein
VEVDAERADVEGESGVIGFGEGLGEEVDAPDIGEDVVGVEDGFCGGVKGLVGEQEGEEVVSPVGGDMGDDSVADVGGEHGGGSGRRTRKRKFIKGM